MSEHHHGVYCADECFPRAKSADTKTHVLVSKAVVQQLLTMDAVVYSIRERHPEVFGGSLWRDLLLALDALRVDVGTRA